MQPTRKRTIVKTVIATLAASLLLGVAGGLVVLRAGWYDVSATRSHFQIVYDLLERGMRYSVERRAREVAVPPLGSPAQVALGAAVYRDNCAQCHAAPGVAQSDIGKSMQPVPGPLVDAAHRWKPAELYRITKHGIKMSGMPAWAFHLNEQEIWAVVAFMQKLPGLSTQDYAALVRPLPPSPSVAAGERSVVQTGEPGNAERGRVALRQYGCAACHVIPGVTGPRVYVGPPLEDIGKRRYIAGYLPNTEQNMVRWIRDPQGVKPHTTMPDLDVTAQDAADMTAYLMEK